jgi:hypothetical protein
MTEFDIAPTTPWTYGPMAVGMYCDAIVTCIRFQPTAIARSVECLRHLLRNLDRCVYGKAALCMRERVQNVGRTSCEIATLLILQYKVT